MEKQRRCLKFTGYVYVPDKEAIDNSKDAKYWIGKQPGRIQFFDEKGQKIGGKMEAFVSLADMANRVNKQWNKMWKGRFK